jgi:peptide/nickel transport system permease protein
MMKRYIFIKIARIVPLLVLISIVTFALLHLAPGGPVGIVTDNPKVSESDIERINRNFGLDRPLAVQYLLWFRQVFLRFDFGTSYVTGRPVSEMILERLPATLELMGAAFILALMFGAAIGVLSALWRGRFMDNLFSIVSNVGISVPVFWIGLMAIYIFSLRLGLFPAGGRETIGGPGSPADRIMHLVLPASVLSLAFLASWSRYIRAGLLDAVGEDFIRTARAKGLSERAVILKHALRSAVLPVITIVFLHLPALFTGAVITETVFAWPGMGRMFYEGLQRHDYTRVLGVVIVSSFLIILFNLIGDLLCALADPRISPEGPGARLPAGQARESA